MPKVLDDGFVGLHVDGGYVVNGREGIAVGYKLTGYLTDDFLDRTRLMSQAQAKRQHTWDVLEGAHTFYLAIGFRRHDDGQFEAFRGDALNVVDEGDMRGQ